VRIDKDSASERLEGGFEIVHTRQRKNNSWTMGIFEVKVKGQILEYKDVMELGLAE
jgi:hypothetical protein